RSSQRHRTSRRKGRTSRPDTGTGQTTISGGGAVCVTDRGPLALVGVRSRDEHERGAKGGRLMTMGWWRQDPAEIALVEETQAFLDGRYAEFAASCGDTRVPVWAWMNLLAHGT